MYAIIIYIICLLGAGNGVNLLASFTGLTSSVLFNYGFASLIEAYPTPFVLGFLNFFTDVMSAKVLWVALRNVIFFLIEWTNYTNLLPLVHFILQTTGLAHLAFLFWLVVILNSMWFVLFVSSIGSFAVAGALVILPLLLLLNFSLMYYLFTWVMHVVFGLSLESPSPNFALLRFLRFVRFITSLENVFAFLYKVMLFTIATPPVAISVAVRLPVEVADLIFSQTLFTDAIATRHLRKKVFLFLTIFMGVSFPLFSLLFFIISVTTSLYVVGSFIAIYYYGLTPFTILLYSIFAFVANILGFSIDFIMGVISKDLIRDFVVFSLHTRSFVSPFVRVYRTSRGLVSINRGTNARDLDTETIEFIFRDLFVVSRSTKSMFYFLLFMYFVNLFARQVVRSVKWVLSIPLNILYALFIASFAFFIPDTIFDVIDHGLLLSYRMALSSKPSLHRFMRVLNLSYIYGVSSFAGGADFPAFKVDKPRLSQLFIRTWVGMTRRSILHFVEWADNVRLPEMIQASYRPPTLDSIRATYVTLQGIGFPVDQSFIDSLDRPEASSYLAEWGSWRNWLIGTSNNALGYADVPLSVRSWLPRDFFPEIVGYQHSTRIANVFTEIFSTARYWTTDGTLVLSDEDFDALVDDTWEAVKPQYENSKLTTFDYVYRHWEKKFNMGFGFFTRNERGKLRQLTRQAVIESFGGKRAFLDAWAKVFKHAQTMCMPSPVFFKYENLKVKKIANGLLRTVLGSAFSHHVQTTIFNYLPNHNYQPWLTPSKVGMPINGQNFNKLWVSLAGHTHVFAGDMTAFDSSQEPPLIRVCQEIRKRGYKTHTDYDRICQLIDISYDMLITQPGGFKNFGDIAGKAKGATTGHSSTTPDNTIMLIANYLFAWRRVTGLRAREFFNFNTLANFGDDHVLGYDPVFGWSPAAAIKAVKELNTIMRDEAPGQDYLPLPDKPLPPGVSDWRDAKFSFLSKKPLPLTPDILGELKSASINVPLLFATCHDRERLLGKIKGEGPARNFQDPRKSYEAILGYIDLCAHHHDIYEKLARMAMGAHNSLAYHYLKNGRSMKGVRKVPSYNDVLRQWYKGEVFDPDFVISDDSGVIDEVTIVINPDPLGYFVRWISDFPTLLSPRYRNTRWADWIQARLAPQLSWPLSFLTYGNNAMLDPGQVRALASRTPYAFLRHELIVPSALHGSYSTLLVRHWLFMGFQRLVSYRKIFSPLDAVRLLDNLFINLLFILTGRVTQAVVELELHVWDTLIVYLLSRIHINFDIPVFDFDVPAPSSIIAQAVTFLFAYFSPAGSIDFQPLELARLRELEADPKKAFVLVAGTGVGKSTRIVNLIQERLRRPTVVVVPRANVAIGVGQYMQRLYPESGIQIATEGFKVTPGFRIVYTTVQSFFLNPLLRHQDNLFIMDEAHINEPAYNVMHIFFANLKSRKIWMTATPGPEISRRPMLVMPSANQFTVHTADVEVGSLSHFIESAIRFCNDRSSFEKVLVFVPTIKLMQDMVGQLHNRTCLLHSNQRVVDETASIFLATSVADAGLTIPDVSFVMSADVDLTVLHNEAGSNVVYFRLSSQTVKQRAGRTGRTSNGAFLLFKIKDIEVTKIVYTKVDYLQALKPAVEASLNYFPSAIKKSFNDEEKSLIGHWDYKYQTTSWSRFQDLVMQQIMMKADNPDYVFEGFEHYADSFGDSVDMDFRDWAAPRDKEVRPLAEVFDDVDFDHPKLNPDLDVPATTGYQRHNVSGRGLLCGAEALVGIFFTNFGLRPDVYEVRDAIIDNTLPEYRNAFSNFFEWTQLRDLMFKKYHIKLRLINEGIPLPDPVDWASFNYHTYTLYLDNGHYNYLGLDFTKAPIVPLSNIETFD
jgi:hypothetical protein